MQKFKKDKVITVRINSQLHELLKNEGMTPQEILDKYIRDYILLDMPQHKKTKE